jgi:hypothetical protein
LCRASGAKKPSTSRRKDVSLWMNKIVSPEVVGAIADTLRESARQTQSATGEAAAPSPSDSARANQATSGVFLFIANLLSNTGLPRIFGGGRPKDAMVRGSLVGLASGVEAVTGGASSSDGATPKWRPLMAILTVLAYVVGGIAAALLLRAIRSDAQPQIDAGSSPSPPSAPLPAN